MIKSRKLVLRLFLSPLFFVASIAGTPAAAALPDAVPSLAPMLEQVMPAVVNVSTRGHVRMQQNPLFNDPFFRRFFDIPEQAPLERQTQSLGSGVVIDAKHGYVLTNHHVIDKADAITVTLRDGRQLDAKLVGADPESDVAVIKVPAENLAALPLGNSDNLRVGDFVVAIGNPFGLGQTVTSGIVSALGRSGLGIKNYENFIQTDASINPGNSGGALVNLKGELIGINTAIYSRNGGNIGIGFAIPINMADQIKQQLIAHGEVSRGRLGVSIQDLTPELAQAFKLKQQRGAVVAQIVKGSPADKAGLKVGDIVIEVNSKKIRNSADLRNVIGLLRIGDTVKLRVRRNGSEHSLKAVIAKPKYTSVKGSKIHPRLKGASFSAIEEGSPLYGKVEGVLVAELATGSPAQRTGLRKDDIILSLNRQAVTNLEEMQAAAKLSKQSLLMNIQRGNAAMFLLIQ